MWMNEHFRMKWRLKLDRGIASATNCSIVSCNSFNKMSRLQSQSTRGRRRARCPSSQVCCLLQFFQNVGVIFVPASGSNSTAGGGQQLFEYDAKKITFIPDYSAIIRDDCTYLEISAQTYLRAYKSTLISRNRSENNPNNKSSKSLSSQSASVMFTLDNNWLIDWTDWNELDFFNNWFNRYYEKFDLYTVFGRSGVCVFNLFNKFCFITQRVFLHCSDSFVFSIFRFDPNPWDVSVFVQFNSILKALRKCSKASRKSRCNFRIEKEVNQPSTFRPGDEIPINKITSEGLVEEETALLRSNGSLRKRPVKNKIFIHFNNKDNLVVFRTQNPFDNEPAASPKRICWIMATWPPKCCKI